MEADMVRYVPGIIGISIGIMVHSIYSIWRKRTGYYEHGVRTRTEKVRGIVVICTIAVLMMLSALILWDMIIYGDTFGLFKSETREALAIIFPVLLIIGALISFIYDLRHKKTGEPDHDERTEKVSGKAAKATIIVLMATCAIILGMFLLGLILWQFQFYGGGAALIIMASMLTVIFLYTATKPREYFIRDERSVRTNEKAGYHAFLILLICISILTVTDWSTDILYKDVSAPLAIIAMGSWSILKWYYDKKGYETDP
ncbi:DUF2178 domain-containing protein [Methanococcoides sp. AM1]|uniref:DUF2178 domain-containing protein n=1 Tax=Methanococcoides sp. AM1 TaxID=1201011 RepID=UPI0010834A9F|nr:DUF2178 domain-containing protein [Methanococcoides sp. AM1]